MVDPHSAEPNTQSEPLTAAEREARIEALLLSGLDHYFAGQYEEAVQIWTRVLFLDRAHARARAYIERARRAQAEQQRETDELLHAGLAAFNRGERDLARRLLTTVVDRGGPNELALACLDRLDRLDSTVVVSQAAPRAPGPIGRPVRARVRAPGGRRARGVLAIVVAVAGLAAAVVVYWDLVERYVTFDMPWLRARPERAAATALPDPPLPVVRPGALALARAERLYQEGRVRDALRVLEGVPRTDASWPDAVRFRARLQQLLLNGLAPASAAPAERSTPPVSTTGPRG